MKRIIIVICLGVLGFCIVDIGNAANYYVHPVKGKDPSDYIPRNKELVKDKDIKILYIPGDVFGLMLGVNPDIDILGNGVDEIPDISGLRVKIM